MVCLWKSHNLDKRALGTYTRVTVDKGIDNCTFTLSQAMNFDSWAIGEVNVILKTQR